MEKYCVSLELARQLKELGFPQETEFYWIKAGGVYDLEYGKKDSIFGLTIEDCIATPHIGELGTWFPAYYVSYMGLGRQMWYCKFIEHDTMKGDPWACDDSEANARAKMLIYLATHSLLNPKTLM